MGNMGNSWNPPFVGFTLGQFLHNVGQPLLFVVLGVGLLFLFDYLGTRRKAKEKEKLEK